MDSLMDELDAQVDQRSSAALALLRELIEINSVNPSYPGVRRGDVLGGETECNKILASWFEAAGLQCDWVGVDPARQNLVARRSGHGDGRSLLLNGHVDTVPPVDASNWIAGSPWVASVQGTRVFGLGAADMKAGLASMWLVAQALQDCGVELGGDLDFHSVVGEEMGEHDLGTTACVSGRSFDAAMVLEPSGVGSRPRIATVCAGNLYLKISLKGKSTHAGNRSLAIRPGGRGDSVGVNAVELGVYIVDGLLELERQWGLTKVDERFPVGFFSILPGVFHSDAGYPGPFYFADRAVVECLIWYPPREDASSVQSEVETYLRRYCANHLWLRENPPDIEWLNHWPPLETTPNLGLVNDLQAGIDEVMTLHGASVDSTVAHFGASCDGSFLERAGIPTLVFGPGDLVLCHARDEYVDFDEVVGVSRALLRAVVKWCGV